jgi:hypothetical protein
MFSTMLPQTAVSTRKRGLDAHFRKKINDKMRSFFGFWQRFVPVEKKRRVRKLYLKIECVLFGAGLFDGSC